MSLFTDTDLSNLLSHDYENGGLFDHFGDFDRWHWPEVSAEARRCFSLIFNTEVEPGSVIDEIYDGSCAQAAAGMLTAVARMLGLDFEILYTIVDDWYSFQDAPPPPIDYEEFISRYNKLCREKEERRQASKARRNGHGAQRRAVECDLCGRLVPYNADDGGRCEECVRGVSDWYAARKD